ncbi:hypothetical protein VNN41_09830 [Lactococcus garvieae]|uniref:hypothetical protein n=1 Tax=Lactococcus garvieae TaxID=1363 RepID=UPI00324F53A3
MKKIKSKAGVILWEINFWHSYFLGFSLLKEVGRASATKILLISKSLGTSKRNGLKIYRDNPDKFEKIFGETDLAGWVSGERLMQIQNELDTICSEYL